MEEETVLVNADNWSSKKWYNHHTFSLVPVLQIKKANYHNTSGFTFRWLFLEMWSLDSFAFELALNIDTHWGIGVTAIIPYLRIKFTIPCPQKIGSWSNNNLDRKPKSHYSKKLADYED
jgi:hypothetical protein